MFYIVLESMVEMQIPMVLWQYAFSGLYQIEYKFIVLKQKEHAVPQLYATRTDFLKMVPNAVRNKIANASTFQVKSSSQIS